MNIRSRLNLKKMSEINWNEVKFRASSWGNLLTEPKTKEEKLQGILSVTCQKELIKIYNLLKYGRKRDIVTKQMEKGKFVEGDSISLFSVVEGQMFYKNEQQLENNWFTGHPDVVNRDNIKLATECHDIKSSWEIDSYMPKLIEENDKGYEAQLNVYFDLIGKQCQSGSIAYCLVSAPENMVMAEKKSLLWKMDVATELSPEFLKTAAELEKLMIYDDIDPRERVIKKPVVRNEELIQKMKDKVPLLRKWLADFEEKHLSLYPK